MKTVVHLLVNEVNCDREWFENEAEMRRHLHRAAQAFVRTIPCEGMTQAEAIAHRKSVLVKLSARIDGALTGRMDGYREGREYEVLGVTYARFNELINE